MFFSKRSNTISFTTSYNFNEIRWSFFLLSIENLKGVLSLNAFIKLEKSNLNVNICYFLYIFKLQLK